MANNDAFTAQLVQLVRQMPEEALLALIRGQLGVAAIAPKRDTTRVGDVAAQPQRKGPKPGSKQGPRVRRTKAERQAALDLIERTVKSSRGVALRDVVKATGFTKVNVKMWLKELRDAKRIFMAGDKTFGRYASDQRTAQAASDAARANPSGR